MSVKRHSNGLKRYTGDIMEMDIMSIKMPKALKAQLENKAKAEGVSQSEVIRYSLRKYLEEYPPTQVMQE